MPRPIRLAKRCNAKARRSARTPRPRGRCAKNTVGGRNWSVPNQNRSDGGRQPVDRSLAEWIRRTNQGPMIAIATRTARSAAPTKDGRVAADRDRRPCQRVTRPWALLRRLRKASRGLVPDTGDRGTRRRYRQSGSPAPWRLQKTMMRPCTIGVVGVSGPRRR